MTPFPWEAAMRFGFGVLHLSSEAFWRLTPRELAAAFRAVAGEQVQAPARRGSRTSGKVSLETSSLAISLTSRTEPTALRADTGHPPIPINHMAISPTSRTKATATGGIARANTGRRPIRTKGMVRADTGRLLIPTNLTAISRALPPIPIRDTAKAYLSHRPTLTRGMAKVHLSRRPIRIRDTVSQAPLIRPTRKDKPLRATGTAGSWTS